VEGTASQKRLPVFNCGDRHAGVNVADNKSQKKAAHNSRNRNAAGDAGEQNRPKTLEDLRTWRSMSEPLNERSCKHLKKERGWPLAIFTKKGAIIERGDKQAAQPGE
jgi:hypothetical protein